MSDQPLRFLHASDFQLDQPLHGLTEIPDHLRDVLIDASYRAAQRLFETAISEKVAFICLCGDLINLARPTARGLSFLLEQFQRLEQHNISVYWAGKRDDVASAWPRVTPLPSNVHCFTNETVESHTYQDQSGFAVRVLGRGGAGEIPALEFTAASSGQYTVAVACGTADAQMLARRNIDYWALGGQLDRKTLFTEPTVAHYCGTPQGRRPENIGPHGCTLVEVRRPRDTHLRFVPCDMVRWQHERVMVSAAATEADLQDVLAQRVGEIRSQAPAIPLLIRWTLTAADGALESDVLRRLAEEADRWLKKQFGYHSEPCWPISVAIDTFDQLPPTAYDEDSLLGDYLRSVRAMQENNQLTVLESPAIPDRLPEDLQWLADLSDSAMRRDVLQEATGLGTALLRGEKVFSSMVQDDR